MILIKAALTSGLFMFLFVVPSQVAHNIEKLQGELLWKRGKGERLAFNGLG